MLDLTKEILELLYIEKKISDQKISDQFKMSRRNVTRLRKVYGIKSIEDFNRFPETQLSNRLNSILIGSLLGDACARKRGKSHAYPQIMFEQTTKHKEYLYWLKKELEVWLFNKNKDIPVSKKFHKITKTYNYSLAFQTVCHPVFNEFYNGFYSTGKKTINFDLVNKYFDELSLAVWIMDDGGLTGKNPRTRLCTNGFSKNDVIKLSEFLMHKYKLKSWVSYAKTKKSMTWELHFDKESSLKITSLIKNIVVPSMQYKLLNKFV